MRDESWGRSHGGGIVGEESWGRNHGGGIMGAASWGRNHEGGINQIAILRGSWGGSWGLGWPGWPVYLFI